jgi:hypothetical protein
VKRWQQVNSAVQPIQVSGGHCFMQQFPEQTALLILHQLGLIAPEAGGKL